MCMEWCLVHGTVKEWDRRSNFELCAECEAEQEASKTMKVEDVTESA
jgi:hypothetical protein